MLLCVNYHYIGRFDYPYPGIYSVSNGEFKKQLEQLGRWGEFIGQQDLLDAVRGEKTLPEKAVLVAFDDGLKCQIENGLKVLDRLKIPAIFFICGLCLAEYKALTVHKIHWLRATQSPPEFLKAIEIAAEKIHLDLSIEEIDAETAIKEYSFDDPEPAKLKYLLNHSLKPESRDRLIHYIFEQNVMDEFEFCRSFYASDDELKELAGRDFLGCHGYAHLSLGRLSIAEQSADIVKGKLALNRIMPKAHQCFSYPYGGPQAVTRAIAEILKKEGFQAALTTEPAINYTLDDPMLLARMDCNDIPGGKAPKFRFNEHGVIPMISGQDLNRSWFREDT